MCLGDQSETLFDQTTRGKLTFPNRFVAAATHYASDGGKVDAKILKTYEDLAKGGVGTILTGFTLVNPVETGMSLLSLADESYVEGHKQLVDLVHKYHVGILSQITYAGAVANYRLLSPEAKAKIPQKEASVDDIKAVQGLFAQTALRAKSLGYDGVEIHHSLYSSFTGRTDAYGGSIENRARNVLETYKAIREAVGPDFPIWIKFNVMFEDTPLDYFLYASRQLAAAGINAIEVAGFSPKFTENDTSFFKKEATAIAEAISDSGVPVIMTGGNRKLSEMTEILRTTKISYFGISKPLVTNPNFVNDLKKEWVELEKKNKINGDL